MTSNPLFRPTQPPKATFNPYARLGLTRNPFPDRPAVISESDDPRLNGSIYLPELRRPQQDRFTHLLVPTAAHPDVRRMAFLMDSATRHGRGVGKTSFLAHQCRRIVGDLGNEATDGTRVVYASHITPPAEGQCRKFWQFARLVARSLTRQGIVARAVWRLRAFSGLLPKEVLELIGDDPQTTIGDDAWLASQGINVTWNLNQHVRQQFLAAGVDDTLAEALATSGAVPDTFDAVWIAQQSDHHWRKAGARLVFDDLARAFQTAGLQRGLLLVDDLERIVVPQNNKERLEFVEAVRYHFLDGPFASARDGHLAALWTIHPYVQELLVSPWNTAGLNRFCAVAGNLAGEHTIEFPSLTHQYAVPLALAYLDASRVPGQAPGQLRPLTSLAVDKALTLTHGLPGLMLALLNRVIEVAAQEASNCEEISPEQVEGVMHREPTISPITPEQLKPPRFDLREDAP